MRVLMHEKPMFDPYIVIWQKILWTTVLALESAHDRTYN